VCGGGAAVIPGEDNVIGGEKGDTTGCVVTVFYGADGGEGA